MLRRRLANPVIRILASGGTQELLVHPAHALPDYYDSPRDGLAQICADIL